VTTPPVSTGAEPIYRILNDLRQALSNHPIVLLQAPPGSGKTTLIPQALLAEEWLADKKIVMLAPRRLAARAAAQRIAFLLGEEVGRRVGYRVRLESRVSPATRIEIVTEGILVRRLQNDPELADTGLVIFDEFHERNLDGDLALTLCRDLQGVLNPSLRLLIMSATLSTRTLAEKLEGPPLICCEGREFPITTFYLGNQAPAFNPAQICRAISASMQEDRGSILVFLPGAAEIRTICTMLAAQMNDQRYYLAPLYGNLSKEKQQLAIAPAPRGIDKVVLATNIAETSLTIDGISTVIDSGLERRLMFDHRRGLSRLITRPITKASAAQRCGRAGRLGPGRCLRLWSEHAHCGLQPDRPPEILTADLSSLVLELAIWGISEPSQLRWLDPPPQPGVGAARLLLQQLEGLDEQGRITEIGKKMAALPSHPRLARMMLAANDTKGQRLACDIAAIIEERDPLSFPPGEYQSNLQLRLDALGSMRKGEPPRVWKGDVDTRQLSHIIRLSDDYFGRLTAVNRQSSNQGHTPGRLLAVAFPDRIAALRGTTQGRYLLANGRGGKMDLWDELAREPYLVVAELENRQREGMIRLAAGYSREDVHNQFSSQLEQHEEIFFDEEQQAIRCLRRTEYLQLVLATQPFTPTDPGAVQQCLCTVIRSKGLGCLQLSEEQEQYRCRIALLAKLYPDDGWPDLSDDWLLSHLEIWLVPFLDQIRSLKELGVLDLTGPLTSRLNSQQQRLLEQLAPRFLQLTTRRIAIDYRQHPPSIKPKLQELFGCTTTPTVAGGRQTLVIHLLSPAGRPLQITQDLHHFWLHSYREIQKEMKGRYPKHHWPDNPLQAEPTSHAKPRKK
jgi:ATP-dependent helicase HrpB